VYCDNFLFQRLFFYALLTLITTVSSYSRQEINKYGSIAITAIAAFDLLLINLVTFLELLHVRTVPEMKVLELL